MTKQYTSLKDGSKSVLSYVETNRVYGIRDYLEMEHWESHKPRRIKVIDCVMEADSWAKVLHKTISYALLKSISMNGVNYQVDARHEVLSVLNQLKGIKYNNSPKGMRRPSKIDGIDVYIDCSHGANKTMEIIKELYDILGISVDDFEMLFSR